jgi:hypothetical protein
MSLINALKNETVTLMMYAFVMGMKHGKPEVTTQEAIDRFYSQFDLTEDVFLKKESARVMLNKVAKRIYTSGKEI